MTKEGMLIGDPAKMKKFLGAKNICQHKGFTFLAQFHTGAARHCLLCDERLVSVFVTVNARLDTRPTDKGFLSTVITASVRRHASVRLRI
ncbi:hypothetical protein J6590_055360 [Homalodisca vitripennis]|nr:hypothetical protein J6590_055360 [Homalodisca vitripennis]